MVKKYLVKLKHLDSILSDDKITVLELLSKKNTLFNAIRFKKAQRIFTYNVVEFLQTDLEKLEYQSCYVKIPSSIDNIPFRARILLDKVNSNNKTTSEFIKEVISTACYDANKTTKVKLKETLDELTFEEAYGIFNWIQKSLKESNILWEKRFLSVKVPNQQYEEAGGDSLSKFNVINTIKMICGDFNLTYDEAWEMPYSIVQTNSFAIASAAFVQHNLSEIKERKMRAQRLRGN